MQRRKGSGKVSYVSQVRKHWKRATLQDLVLMQRLSMQAKGSHLDAVEGVAIGCCLIQGEQFHDACRHEAQVRC